MARQLRAVAASHQSGSVPQIHARALDVALAARASSAPGGRHRRLKLALTSASIALTQLTIAPGVRAQEANASVTTQRREIAPRGAVRVSVTTPEDDLLITVAQPGKPHALVSCHHHCSFWGVPGSYALWATSHQRGIRYQTTLRVGPSTEFKVSSGHHAERNAGLIAGVLGPVTAGVGMLLIAEGIGMSQCDACEGHGDTALRAGSLMFVVGLLATPIGWGVFAFSRETRVDSIEPEPQPMKFAPPGPPRDPRLQLGVLALPRGGWGVGLSTLF